VGNSDGEIRLRAFLRTDDGRFGVAGQLFGNAVGVLWAPGGDPTTLTPIAGWNGESVSAVSVPEGLRESVVEKGSGLPGRAWATGQIAWPASDERRVAIPVPIGPSEQVEVVVDIFGEFDIQASEDAEVMLAEFAGQLFNLLRGSRPDPAVERPAPLVFPPTID